ncbi:MAG: hypothetical protein JSU63_12595 [Phycisphaerales bacterium]|nr:MAG: hypothetical protein JSU63_12595 [Phycisphaerales bacterium]
MSYRVNPVQIVVLSAAILLAASSIALAQPEIRWHPVHAEDKVVCLPSEGDCSPNEIILSGGGVLVTLFMQLDGWDPDDDGIPTLGGYQGTLDATTYEGGLPPDVAYTGHPGNPGTSPGCDLRTMSWWNHYPSCHGAFVTLKVCCSNMADPLNTVDWLSDCGSDASVCGSFPAGCIDRPDFVYAGLGPTPPEPCCPPDCGLGFASTDCRADDDSFPYYYGGTLKVEVRVCATGTYNVGFVNDNEHTLFNDCGGVLIPGLTRTPAQITILPDLDCNDNGVLDATDIADETSSDCNLNDFPDECEVPPIDPFGQDCNENLSPDECEADCDGDDTPDACELPPFGNSDDCNTNSVPDECELPPLDPDAPDCNANFILDECEVDCQPNSVPDDCDVDPADPDGNQQVSADCDANSVPDECQPDCDGDDTPDACELPPFGTSEDCNFDGVPDECQPDEDCNDNSIRDICDIGAGTSPDWNGNLIPDECDPLTAPALPADEEHRARKHRFISFDPHVNGANEVAYRVDLVSMRRCTGRPERACTFDSDCEETFPGAGTCGEHPDVGASWWIQQPQNEPLGCPPDNVCGPTDQFARLGSAPYFAAWTLPLLHIGDCATIPIATYEVRACQPPDGIVCSDPLTLATTHQSLLVPGFRCNWGDIASSPTVGGEPWGPPDGYTNVVDEAALLYTIAYLGTGVQPQAHPTWVEMTGLGDGAPPNYIVNVTDLQVLEMGIQGYEWTDVGYALNPGDCP